MEHKRRRREETDSRISEDVIVEIISRLLVKDLLRFKCVSKSWSSLITTDSHLSNLQLQRAASDRPFVVLRKEKYVLKRNCYKFYNYMFDVYSLGDQNTRDQLVEIQNPFDRGNAPRRRPRDAKVVASCDGLLVLKQRDTCAFALLNPSTGKYHIVPPNPAGDKNVFFSGFGYEYDCDCYKLVTIVKPSQSHQALDLMIYDVNGTWRKIQSRSQYDDGIERLFSYGIVYSSGTYVNGYLYWHEEMEEDGYSRLVILGFGIEEEEFFETIVPDFGGDTAYHDSINGIGMVAFDEKLCLVCTSGAEDGPWIRFDIFVMNVTYDEETEQWWSCWTKLFSVNWETIFGSDGGFLSTLLIPQCYSACRNKVLFNVDFERLVWYNLETEEFEEFRQLDNPIHRMWCSFNLDCVRSLIGNGIF